MLKKFVTLAAVLALSGIAFGADNAKSKISSFIPLGEENAIADGMAILHYNATQNETSVQIMLTDFHASTTYDFDVVSGSQGTASHCDVLVTDDRGRVHFKTTLVGNWTDAEIAVYFSDDCTFTQDELRAIGTPDAN